MAEPMTPATLGPMACIRRKLVLLYFLPTSWDTRAAIGTAETPAEPMSGLILPPESRYMIRPPSRPPTVEMAKATRPRTMILMVFQVRNRSAVMVAPTEVARKMVTMFMRAFWAVSLRRSATPHSRNRLPSIRQPISGAVEGRSRMTKAETMIGKMIFSVLVTSRFCSILTTRISGVVRAFMMGGWISGIRAI